MQSGSRENELDIIRRHNMSDSLNKSSVQRAAGAAFESSPTLDWLRSGERRGVRVFATSMMTSQMAFGERVWWAQRAVPGERTGRTSEQIITIGPNDESSTSGGWCFCAMKSWVCWGQRLVLGKTRNWVVMRELDNFFVLIWFFEEKLNKIWKISYQSPTKKHKNQPENLKLSSMVRFTPKSQKSFQLNSKFSPLFGGKSWFQTNFSQLQSSSTRKTLSSTGHLDLLTPQKYAT